MPDQSPTHDLNDILSAIDHHLRSRAQVVAARNQLDNRINELEAALNGLHTQGRTLVTAATHQGPYFTDARGEVWHLRGPEFVRIPTVKADQVRPREATVENGGLTGETLNWAAPNGTLTRSSDTTFTYTPPSSGKHAVLITDHPTIDDAVLSHRLRNGLRTDDCGSEPTMPPAIRAVDEEPAGAGRRNGDGLADTAVAMEGGSR